MKSKKSIYVQMEKRTKRKVMPNAQDGTNKPKTDLNTFKLAPNAYPTDHPFNKDGYKYVLAEPDQFAPYRKEFDESEDWAGKQIPGFLYRKLCPKSVLLAMHDRAPQLKVADDRLTVTGEKGYCMIRATHAVNFGCWYYEIDILSMPEGSATRLGWSLEHANLHGPCGYDQYGYSWRSRKGTVFNDARGKHYSDVGYQQGDTIGCLIDLPEDLVNENPVNLEYHLDTTYKEWPLVKVKNFLYFETKDNPVQVKKNLRPLKNGKISFYRNGENQGVAFNDIHCGFYYPTASFYKNCVVKFNFGPDFKHPPKDVKFRGVHEIADEYAIKQTMSELMYFTENENKLDIDSFYQKNKS